MFARKLLMEYAENESVFLFGARQTGKTTFVKEKFPDAKYYDLLKFRRNIIILANSKRIRGGCCVRRCTSGNRNKILRRAVQAALKGLTEKEFVTRDEKGYMVYDKFFEIWLKEKY